MNFTMRQLYLIDIIFLNRLKRIILQIRTEPLKDFRLTIIRCFQQNGSFIMNSKQNLLFDSSN